MSLDGLPRDIGKARSALTIAVRDTFPGLNWNLTLKSEWNSNSPDYRKTIRTELALELSSLFVGAEFALANEAIADLAGPPKISGWSLSISHASELGGYAWCRNPAWLGLDIEDPRRVTAPIVNRIATSQEIAVAPSAVSLWCTKEASFKALALSGARIKTVTECHCFNWRPAKEPSIQIADIEFKGLVAGSAFFYEAEIWALGLFISNPST